MLSKLKSAIKKAREKDKAAREKEVEGQSLKKTIAQIKAFFTAVGVLAPIAGWATLVFIGICAVVLPILMLSQVIGGVLDTVKEFGASVGNLFTNGCYGTDEECLEREEAKQEQDFKKSIEEAKNSYRTNKNGKMNNELYIGTGGSSQQKTSIGTTFGIGDTTASVKIAGSMYNVQIQVSKLVSALMYFETTVSSYEEMQQENMICDKLMALGFIKEGEATCERDINSKDFEYEWYEFQLPEDDLAEMNASGGYLKPEDTLADQTGIDVYKILEASRGNVDRTDEAGQCGSFDSEYLKGYGIIYSGDEEKSVWDSFKDWISGSGDEKVNRLKSLAKFSIKKDVSAVCRPYVTDPCPDGYIDDGNGGKVCSSDKKYYGPEITITVTYRHDDDRFKKYLQEEYVPSQTLEQYLFEQVDLLRKEYEKDNGKELDGTGDTKAFLNSVSDKIQQLGEEYLTRREEEKEKNEKIFGKLADDIINLASVYDEEWSSADLISAVCPGVTVTGENAGVYSLEEYIAGVIAHEAYADGGEEALKAQAVAARTYLLKTTNNCTSSIANSDSAQTFNPNPGEYAKKAANDTAGEVLTMNGELVLTMYDSYCYDDSDCPDAVCDASGCSVTYTKLPNKEQHKVELKTDKQRARIVPGGGHAQGMSQLASYEMAANGSTYKEILQFFYSDGAEVSVIATGAGLEEIDGFPARTTRALRDNIYFYGDGAGNEGECAWYAVRRTNEILASYGKTARVTSGGNGADFCYAPDYQQFTSTTNVDEIQPGDVVSWGGGNGHSYGHVAVIEVVYRDASGKVTSALTSEGGNSFGSGYGTYYKGHYVDNSYIWGLSSGSYKNEVRAYNCEGSTGLGTGCQNFRVRTRAQLMAPSSSYRLNCFIHLVG